MLNEWIYCPRLAFLEWVDGEWADSGDTEEGRRAHVRVDSGGGKLPTADQAEDKPDFAARSVTLGSEALGIIARMDLIEGENGTVTPVDTKKGKRPHVAEGAYEPERVVLGTDFAFWCFTGPRAQRPVQFGRGIDCRNSHD